jgi:hypothetical protein
MLKIIILLLLVLSAPSQYYCFMSLGEKVPQSTPEERHAEFYARASRLMRVLSPRRGGFFDITVSDVGRHTPWLGEDDIRLRQTRKRFDDEGAGTPHRHESLWQNEPIRVDEKKSEDIGEKNAKQQLASNAFRVLPSNRDFQDYMYRRDHVHGTDGAEILATIRVDSVLLRTATENGSWQNLDYKCLDDRIDLHALTIKLDIFDAQAQLADSAEIIDQAVF